MEVSLGQLVELLLSLLVSANSRGIARGLLGIRLSFACLPALVIAARYRG